MDFNPQSAATGQSVGTANAQTEHSPVTGEGQSVQTPVLPAGVELLAPVPEHAAHILTPAALGFVADLHRNFNDRRVQLLSKRQERQKAINAGQMPDFLPETREIREGVWTVAPLPQDLLDRRVEITGPVDRKMIINALNSGAKVFMADFEDANSPTWTNCVDGQVNLNDAVLERIEYTNPSNGKHYSLNEDHAVLMTRPRGWHLVEKHVLVDGQPVSASLFDFGLYFYHNAQALLEKGSGPYFYLPKLESHLEARLWNDVFVQAQQALGIRRGSIKATVLVETILAAFELHEILYELREHSAGLNCGRWDYIFSYIKRFRNVEGFVLPDRGQVTMTVPFMSAYSQLVIQTCHRRGVHAMGGMAAFIPIKGDEAANNAAIEKVRQDKELEARNGHDGTWVAHPGLVGVAMDIFDAHMPGPNQIDKKRHDLRVCARDLVEPSTGTITDAGLRQNINVGILYIESWLQGVGAAALYNLMEDAATAEISRTQVWQWVHRAAKMDDGRTVTMDLVEQLLPEEMEKIRAYVGEERFAAGQFRVASEVFLNLVRREDFIEFLTLPAYELLD
jgi:malate synthase